ncbi:MAG: hypothetical protein ABIQ09_00295 [Jatrophihabitantaceae bacterium]
MTGVFARATLTAEGSGVIAPAVTAAYAYDGGACFFDAVAERAYRLGLDGVVDGGRHIRRDAWWLDGLDEALTNLVTALPARWSVSARAHAGARSAIACADISEREGAIVALQSGDAPPCIRRFGPGELVHVSGMLLLDGRLVATDDYLHVALVLNDELATVSCIGNPGRPEASGGVLTSPSGAAPAGDGIVVGSRRLGHWFYVDLTRETAVAAPLPAGLYSAEVLCGAAGGPILICDSASGQVLVLPPDAPGGAPPACWAPQGAIPTGPLRGPRAVQPLDGGLLFADCLNNRVVWAAADGSLGILPVTTTWPRAVVPTRRGLAIAEGLTGRILGVNGDAGFVPEGCVAATISATIVVDGLGDPHHLSVTLADELLVTDSKHGDVLIVGADGAVRWRWSTDAAARDDALHDPHQSWMDADGAIWVIDSLHHRLLCRPADPAAPTRVVLDLAADQSVPRFVLPLTDGRILLSARGRTLRLYDGEWRQLAELWIRATNGVIVPLLDPPRSLARLGGDLIIPDHDRGTLWRIPAHDLDRLP